MELSACYNLKMVYSPRSNSSRQLHKANRNKKLPQIVYFALPVVFLFGLGVGYLVWGIGNESKQVNNIEAREATPVRYNVSVDDDPYLGPINAPVTIIMFSDYQCPFCQKWYLEVLQPLMQNFKGKIRFVYRDFPLSSIHASATLTAEAADCASDQGKYWEYFNAVFSGTDSLSESTIQKYATAINLDLDLFNQCLSSRKYKDEVEGDYSYATALGVQSTPTFFVNGIPVIGAQPYQVFENLVSQELSQ